MKQWPSSGKKRTILTMLECCSTCSGMLLSVIVHAGSFYSSEVRQPGVRTSPHSREAGQDLQLFETQRHVANQWL